MKKFFLFLFPVALLLSCNDTAKKSATADNTPVVAADKPAVDLPYTASYSGSFNSDVSDQDLKMVLTSYKDWADGNVKGVADAMADTLEFDAWDGSSSRLPRAGLLKRWTAFRDSMSSVKVEMEAWHKMHSTDKNENFIVVWYKEYDVFKSGKVDSSNWHDINQVKDGKISYYAQYKKPMKK
ncbi:MAG: hypothetical protein ABI760_10910 [Ferruginibacter sp.]